VSSSLIANSLNQQAITNISVNGLEVRVETASCFREVTLKTVESAAVGATQYEIESMTMNGCEKASGPEVVGTLPAELVTAIMNDAGVKARIGGPVTRIEVVGQQRCPGCFRVSVDGKSAQGSTVTLELQTQLNMMARPAGYVIRVL